MDVTLFSAGLVEWGYVIALYQKKKGLHFWHRRFFELNQNRYRFYILYSQIFRIFRTFFHENFLVLLHNIIPVVPFHFIFIPYEVYVELKIGQFNESRYWNHAQWIKLVQCGTR